MLRIFYIFILLTSLIYAKDKVEIFATSVDSKDNIVNAQGEVTVVYKDYFLSAKRAKYNKQSGDLELFDRVRVNHASKYKLLGDYAKLNIKKKERMFKPFFFLDKETQVWMSADKGCGKNDKLSIKSGVLSGCDPNDPLWTMEFSSSDYNTESKWLNMYNTRLYIYDILVFYTPYFGYPLDTTRRTGLLIPSYGISGDEGFFFQQPIYIAEQNWWDLELNPQIRTTRGYGGYTTFRFVDSIKSKGTITTGYFKEKSNYFKRKNLAHDSHYGFNFKYENTDFLNQWFGTKLKGQSGIYADINNMNDVDYINLASNDSLNDSTATLILSNINMFYNTDRNYYGAYFKYYKDLTKTTNEDTLQKLPTIQYHHYLETLLKDHILYSIDIKSDNIQREINKTAIQTTANIPVTFRTTLFDEYLNVSFKTQLYAQQTNFSGNEETSTNSYKNGYFARNYNIIDVNTKLTKAYEDFTHVIQFGSSYTFDGAEAKTGYYEENKDFCSKAENANSKRCEFYNINQIEDEFQIDFAQYIYDKTSSQVVYHRLSQAISNEDLDSKLGELENELDYQITKKINFYNNSFYNYDENSFSKFYNKLTYKAYGFDLSISHMYKDTFLEATSTYTPYTSYITSSLGYTYNEHYSYNAAWNYDVEDSNKKGFEVGFMYKKRCWDFGIKYLENNRPILTQNNSDSAYDRYIYFTIILKPLMRSGSEPIFGYDISDES